MFRRLVLLTTCVALVMGAGSAQGGLLYELLHPLLRTHKRTVAHHAKQPVGETVWSGLIMAENVEKPEPVPAELAEIEPTLKELFGYNQFKIIGQHQTALRKGTENWDTASKHFALHVDAKEPSDGGYLVNLRLVQHDDGQSPNQPASPANQQSPSPTAAGQPASGGASPAALAPNEQVVLETDTKLSKQSPLVIRGPQVGSGQLILVLVVQ